MRNVLIIFAVAAAACGGSSRSSSSDDVRTLNGLATQAATAAASYGDQAAGMTDTTSCSTAESTYEGQIRPMLTQMQGMAPSMDQMMASLGMPADSDMACATAAMVAELDRHHAAACTSTTDMGPNKTEAHDHVETMTMWADHQQVRSHAMGTTMGSGMGGMGMGGMSGDGMTTGHCVHDQDGTYSTRP